MLIAECEQRLAEIDIEAIRAEAAAPRTASQKLPFLTRQPVVCGVLYGMAVYAVMYMAVLPLSAYHFKFFNQPGISILIGVLIHIFCVGLPIALVARWRATLPVM